MVADNGSELSPGQAAFRFLIELAALACWGIAGWQLVDGAARWILVVLLPGFAAFLWGAFRAPDDHSANGASPIPVPGLVRLLLELDVLLGAALVVALVWRPAVGGILAIAVVAHYASTPGRIRWLLAQRTVR